MKPASFLSAFFAALGLYLTVLSLVAVTGSLVHLKIMTQFSDNSINRWMVPLQLLSVCLPLVVGVLLFVFARQAGLLAARASGIGEETKWEVQLKPCDLLTVLIAVLGVYQLVINIPHGVQVALLFFQIKAGSHDIALSASRSFPNNLEFLAVLVGMAGGVVLVRYCAVIARWIMRKV
ncbi:MAG: hypothetical protein LBM92_02225 [Opitutaceae bacterium]|jgi:hypothetical protein|nr:hypothetical protein [Opitutaceae bacterium]